MIKRSTTAIIIDDDKDAISLLEIYLHAFDEVEVIGSTTDPQRGIKLLKKKVPNLVFLDIDMPDLDGMEVAETMKENELPTEIIFTTAHAQYAYKSLQVEPLGYLVKPFGPEDLISVINRYHAKVKRLELERRMHLFMKTTKTIPRAKFTTRSGIIFINPDDIMLMRAESNYCRIFLKDGREELITTNIFKAAARMDSPEIVKANRSAYVNVQYLTQIEKRTKICTLKYKDKILEEPINSSSLSFFEKLNCFPIT
ncbi:LytR/AlgR family response regulator transcription factor [Gaoshiqia sp. Z1-71]|uniref:LytR/AlgR family response regulator transcription factor n=1 Tax=Gaoshiqia hydrogeniformans TaxID=3290090 RepID=UPI003BF80D11